MFKENIINNNNKIEEMSESNGRRNIIYTEANEEANLK